MKIVHICLCGPFTDGWNYQENLLTKYHKRMGLDVTVLASRWTWGINGKKQLTSQIDYYNQDGVHVIRLPLFLGTVDTRLKWYRKVSDNLEKISPDIIFVHDVQFLNELSILRYAKKHNVRIYIDNHVDYSNGASTWLSKHVLHKGLWRTIAKLIEPYTTTFYGVLPARVDILKELYHLPEEKCKLLVMGADDELVFKASNSETRQELREKYHIAEDDFLIVTGGKIDRFKKQTLLLMEAIRSCQLANVKLLFFGSIEPEMETEVKDLLDDETIQYAGWIDANDSYRFFAAADLVAFPGRHSVFWEQVCAQGIPMICKEWKGTKHTDLGGNVRYLHNDSVEEMRALITQIVTDRSCYETMKSVAEGPGRKHFLYSEIAEKAIDWK